MLNVQGKRLLGFCEEYGLTTLNGRLKRDLEGRNTYIGCRGASVLNYVIVKKGDEKLPISRMCVGLREESDHLSLELDLEGMDKKWREKEDGKKVKECWIWKESKKNEFRERLETK